MKTFLIESIGAAENLTGPSVAINGEDDRIFTYNVKDSGGDFHVYFVRYDSDENKLDTTPVQVDKTTPAGADWLYIHPSVATFENGDFAISWLSEDQAIYTKRFDSTGTEIDTDDILLVAAGDIEDPEMDVFRDKIYLTWMDILPLGLEERYLIKAIKARLM